MKKFFMIIFVVFCSIIFYQIVLGKNGLIESYRIQKLKEKLIIYRQKLIAIKNEQANYIDFLKNDPDAMAELAAEFGFYHKDGVKLVKIIDDSIKKNEVGDDESRKKFELLNIDEITLDSLVDKKIHRMRIWLKVLFFLFFGFFIVLILMGGKKLHEE